MFELKLDFDESKLQTWANDIGATVNHWDRLVRNAVAITARETALVAKSFIGSGGPPIFNKGGYSSRPWDQLSPRTPPTRRKNKENPQEILLDTGALRDSIDFKTVGTMGYVFSKDPKADSHEQDGVFGPNGRRIPGRPFLTPAMYYVQYDTIFESALEKFVKQNFDFMEFDKRHRAEYLFYKASIPKSSGIAKTYKASGKKNKSRTKRIK